MVKAKIVVSGVHANVEFARVIPMGMIGAQVEFEFLDAPWDSLSKTIVFRGCETRDVVLTGNTAEIPAEVLAMAGFRLLVGVYGVDSNAAVAVPTLWADLGRIRSAADPSGDPAADPALPIWAQLQQDIDDLKENPPTQFDLDEETLSLEEGILSVKTTNEVVEDDPRPITSGAVYNEFSKAVALLKTI